MNTTMRFWELFIRIWLSKNQPGFTSAYWIAAKRATHYDKQQIIMTIPQISKVKDFLRGLPKNLRESWKKRVLSVDELKILEKRLTARNYLRGVTWRLIAERKPSVLQEVE